MSIKQQVRKGRRDAKEVLDNLVRPDDEKKLKGYKRLVAWLAKQIAK